MNESVSHDLLCLEGDHEEIYDPAKGEFICWKCGLVLGHEFERKIELPPERVASLSSRVNSMSPGARGELVDGMGSYIDFHNTRYLHDCNYRPLSPRSRFLFRRLKKRYELKSHIAKRERDFRVLAQFSLISSDLKLSRDDAARATHLYQKFSRKLQEVEKIKRSNISMNLLAVCIVLAMKESKSGAVLTVKEVAASFKKFRHRVSSYSIIRTALLLKCELDGIPVNLRSKKSEEYVPGVVNQIISDGRIKQRLQEKIPKSEFEFEKALIVETQSILERLPDEERGGRNPYFLAVSAVYGMEKCLSKKWRYSSIFTQKLLAEITGASSCTIKDGWKSLIEPLIHN